MITKKVMIGNMPAVLKDCIGHGGAGSAWKGPLRRDSAVKTHDNPEPTNEARARHLIANPVLPLYEGNQPNYAWPREPVYDAITGEWIGIEMPMVSGIPFKGLFDPRFRLRGMNETWLHTVATNFVMRIHVLHLEGYRCGDINGLNFLAARNGHVTQVDIDSLCFTDPGGKVYGPERWIVEFQAPELIDCVPSSANYCEHHDAWGAYTLAHMLLRDGLHPFDAEWIGAGSRPSTLDNLRNGVWVDSGLHPQFRPRRNAKPFASLPKRLQALFQQMFHVGHSDYAKRPDVTELLTCLMETRKVSFFSPSISQRKWNQAIRGDRSSPSPKPIFVPPKKRRNSSKVAAAAVSLCVAIPSIGITAGRLNSALSTTPTEQTDSTESYSVDFNRSPLRPASVVDSTATPVLWQEHATLGLLPVQSTKGRSDGFR